MAFGNDEMREASHGAASSYDVVVVGSGAGAMMAAICAADKGLSVLVIEKSNFYGGTSALSGGVIWVPCNHQQAAAGITDSRHQALTYLKVATRGMVSEARLLAYLDNAPKMVKYLEDRTPVRYAILPSYPDYYQALRGALPGGRILDPDFFDISVLGEEFQHLRSAARALLVTGKVSLTTRVAVSVLQHAKGWQWAALKLMARYYSDIGWRIKTKRDRRSAGGNALVAGLRRGMLDRAIPLWLRTEFKDLCIEGGRACGIVAEQNGYSLTIRAGKAVILASGGFEQNQALREKYLPQPTNNGWSVTPPHNNTGAALLAAEKAGAATALMEHAWWAPTVAVAEEDTPRAIFIERHQPGCIVVNNKGERFVNEAAPYKEFVEAMYENNGKNGCQTVPAWLVFDANFRARSPMGPLMPSLAIPDKRLPKSWRSSVYWKGETLSDLAQQIGVDATGLAATVQRFNQYARDGKDLDFDKGGSCFDRYFGVAKGRPNPCLAPIEKGPFYAMKFDPGDTGTKGGILTDEHARVIAQDGSTIPGLYAIGNASASVMGPSYPGAGATIGPAMTFAYVAVDHIAATPAANRSCAGEIKLASELQASRP